MLLLHSIKQYPRTVFFILGNELCERFSYFGMKALLTVYLLTEHHFQESTATLFYHFFSSLANISSLLGALLADSYFGRFRVILVVSCFYVLGHGLLSTGAIPSQSLETRTLLDFSGLIIISLATGGIKPCVSAFAVDQFPDSQSHLRTQFFAFFYFAINVGSLCSVILTPILKARVTCFGSDTCFPLAFGVPALLMFIALLLFLIPSRNYRKLPASHENVALKSLRIIRIALSRKAQGEKQKEGKDWMSLAEGTFASCDVQAIRSFMHVALLLSPIVLFWTLFDQKGSTWVLLARRLNGRICQFTILPEQINFLNPLLILIFVPIFEGIIFPLAKKVIRVTPLRKMACGGILTALSFCLAGLVQLRVNEDLPLHIPANSIGLQMLGDVPLGGSLCSEHHCIGPEDLSEDLLIETPGVFRLHGNRYPETELNFTSTGRAYVLGIEREGEIVSIAQADYQMEKAPTGTTTLLFISTTHHANTSIFLVDNRGEVQSEADLNNGQILQIRHAFLSSPDYVLYYGKNCTGVDCPNAVKIYAQMGAVHGVYVIEKGASIHQLVKGNSVSIGWLIPQYILLTLGEMLLSITALDFAYSQAAPSMKSMTQALWQLTIFLGSLIAISISGTHVIPAPATEFFVYAALMMLCMLVFIGFATQYTYVEYREKQSALEDVKEEIQMKNIWS